MFQSIKIYFIIKWFSKFPRELKNMVYEEIKKLARKRNRKGRNSTMPVEIKLPKIKRERGGALPRVGYEKILKDMKVEDTHIFDKPSSTIAPSISILRKKFYPKSFTVMNIGSNKTEVKRIY